MTNLECKCFGEVEFSTLVEGLYCKNESAANYVLQTAGDYVTLRNKTEINAPSSNTMDFSKEMVLAVFQGKKSTGGYNIKIKNILETKDTLEVYIKETCPSEDMIVTQAFTSPYHLVKTKYISKKVTFKYE